jgi:hypothetical protein
VTNHRPVYPGDTLRMVVDSRTVTDLTPPEGSIFRSLALRTEGSVYNQRGEKVNDCIWRVVESMRVFKPERRPSDFDSAGMWDASTWTDRPAHYYTDDDWQFITSVWETEHRLGDHGWLHSIGWGLMPPATMAAYGRPVPTNPDCVRFPEKVPHMCHRYADAHGMTTDLALVKSYVYDKYVRDGEFLVELAWWIETITGHIWTDGHATVRLPSRRIDTTKNRW